jgi:hypothetical protein
MNGIFMKEFSLLGCNAKARNKNRDQNHKTPKSQKLIF